LIKHPSRTFGTFFFSTLLVKAHGYALDALMGIKIFTAPKALH